MPHNRRLTVEVAPCLQMHDSTESECAVRLKSSDSAIQELGEGRKAVGLNGLIIEVSWHLQGHVRKRVSALLPFVISDMTSTTGASRLGKQGTIPPHKHNRCQMAFPSVFEQQLPVLIHSLPPPTSHTQQEAHATPFLT